MTVAREVPADAWHPSVTAYEVWDKKRLVGKFYLDLFARENKYKHAAMFTIRTGKTLRSGERQTPMAALVCNFPKPGEEMQHSQVVTYFHEFGHVLGLIDQRPHTGGDGVMIGGLRPGVRHRV